MIIKSKYSAPFIKRDLIARESLHRKLAEQSQVILVQAPLGSGKTCLVWSWLQTIQSHFGWLNLDEQDNQPERFWSYLWCAITDWKRNSGVNQVRETLYELPDMSFLAYPYNDSEAMIAKCVELLNLPEYLDFVLVLDDLFVISNKLIWQQFNLFLNYLPDTVRVVLISRHFPFIKIQHRKARGQLKVVDYQDLKFSLDETRLLLESKYGMSLDQQQLVQIDGCAEGWVASLHLLAGAMLSSSEPDFTTQLRIAENEVLSYLSSEVFEHLEKAEKQRLLLVSCFDEIDEFICLEIFNSVNFDFSSWVSQSAFLFKLHSQPGQYRFHILFKKMLYGKLQADSDLWQQALKHRVGWFINKKQFEEALKIVLKLKDWQWISDILEELGHELLKQGRNDLLEECLDVLPDRVLWSNAKLLCIKTWLLKDVDKFNVGDTLLDHAESLLVQNGHELNVEEEAILGEVFSLKAIVARLRYDQEQTLYYSKKALQLAGRFTSPLRWRPHMSVGADYYYRGELLKGIHHLSQAYELAKLEGHAYGVALSGSYSVEALFQNGQLLKAKSMVQDIDGWLEVNANETLYESWRYLAKAGLNIEKNELNEAQAAVSSMLSFKSHQECEPLQQLSIVLVWLRLLFIQKDFDSIDKALDELEAISSKIQFNWPFPFAYPEWLRIKVSSLKGNWETAYHLFDVVESQIHQHDSFVTFPNRMIAASIYLRRSQIEEARKIIDGIKSQFDQEIHVYLYGKARVMDVRVLMKEGKNKAAENLLLDVIEQYVELGYINLILEEGNEIQKLVCQLHHLYPSNRYLQRLVAHVDPDFLIPTVKLSNREFDILLMLDQAKSDREISSILSITLGTVKTHLRNIYRKLEVKSRGQAVNKAKDLDLIE